MTKKQFAEIKTDNTIKVSKSEDYKKEIGVRLNKDGKQIHLTVEDVIKINQSLFINNNSFICANCSKIEKMKKLLK